MKWAVPAWAPIRAPRWSIAGARRMTPLTCSSRMVLRWRSAPDRQREPREALAGDWFAGVDPGNQMSGLQKETFDSYRAGNEQIKFIDDLIRDYPAVHLLKDNDSQAIFKENRNGWMEFAKRFPSAKGFIQFSAVGFNLGHTQALVSVEHQCGGVCGNGKFMLLRKTNSVWRVQRKVVTWE